MFQYSQSVFKTYLTKAGDGTLKAIKASGETPGDAAEEEMVVPTEDGYLTIGDLETETAMVPEYRDIIADPQQWEEFNETRLEPCFRYVENLSPFETVEYDLGPGSDADDEADFENTETHIAPVQIIKLGLKKIDQQFPETGKTDFGDHDIRRGMAALMRIFYHNYHHLNRGRHQGVAAGMAMLVRLYATVVCFVVLAFAVAVVQNPAYLQALRPAYPAFVRSISTSADMHVLLTMPFAGTLLAIAATLAAPFAIQRLIEYRHRIHSTRFAASTVGASNNVCKSVRLRQENLVHTTQKVMEQINQGREEAWARGHQADWVAQTGKWTRLNFWLHNRIGANQECLRIRMKLIGMMYVGLRAQARLRALWLIVAHQVYLAVWMMVGVAISWSLGAFTLAGKPLIEVHLAAMGVLSLIALYLYVAGWMAQLHDLVKANTAPKAIYTVIRATEAQRIKGTRDARLDEEMAESINRDKLRLQMEEDKRRI